MYCQRDWPFERAAPAAANARGRAALARVLDGGYSADKANFITDMTMERGDSPLAGRRPAPLNNVRSMNALSIGTSAPLSSLHAPNSASALQSMPSLPPLGGLSTSLQSPGSAPHGTTSFWRELKDVELWFDSLDPQERVTLVATLAARAPEQQLHQFASTIDKALRNQNSANLSRFGVGQDQSVYRYRSPLSAGGPATGGAAGSGASAGASQPAAAVNGRTPVQAPASSVAAASATAAAPAPVSSTPGASASGAVAGSAPGSAKNYSHAFLPLGYSPWGTEIRRPNSATTDAWPDTSRGSPTVANAEPDGSPIGLKPWRTFTPQQPIGSQIGQAPERSLLYPYRLYQNGSSASVAAPHAHSQLPQSGHELSRQGSGGPSGLASAGLGGSGLGGSGLAGSGLGGAGSGLGGASGSAFASGSGSARSGGSGPGGSGGSGPGGSGSGGPGGSGGSSGPGGPGGGSSGPSGPGGPGGSGRSGGAGPSGRSGPESGPESAPDSAPESTHEPAANGHRLHAHAEDEGTHASEPRARRSVNVVDVELLSDIGAWLRSLRLHKYTGNLSGMHWQDVIQLSDQDLEVRGVNALGARRKLLKMFEEIRHAQEEGLLVE